MMIHWLFIQILFSTAPSGDCVPANVRKANYIERIVRLEYRIVNELPLAQDVRIFLALPQSNERQEVFSVFPEPGWKEMARDRFGNLFAIYEEKAVRPGEMRRRGWMASVRRAILPSARRRLLISFMSPGGRWLTRRWRVLVFSAGK